MAKVPTNEQAGEFHLRPGVDPFGGSGWRGVNTQKNPTALDPNELQRAIDVRLRGGEYYTRPGMTQVLDLRTYGPTLISGEVEPLMWMHEAPVDNPRVRLWGTTLGCFGTTALTGGTLFHIDPMETPAVQNYGRFFSDADKQIPFAQYGDDLYVGDKSVLRRIEQITSPTGVAVDIINPSPPNQVAAVFAGYTIRALREFDGLLFVSLEDIVTIGASKVVVWDGIAWENDITAIRPVLAFGEFQEKLVAGFDSTAANIRVRNPGVAPGTWNTFALAGFQCAPQGNAMQQVRQYTYIAGGTDELFRFNGTALTLATTVTGADTTNTLGVTGLCLYQGLLHYIWNAATTFNTAIGRHDPDSTAANEWVDTYKDVTADQANFKRGESIATYRQQIVIGGNRVWLAATATNDAKGTLVVLNNGGAASAGFGVKQLIRYPAA